MGNMFKTTTAKTPTEYLDLLAEPNKSEIAQIHAFVTKAAPELEPFILNGSIAYGPYHYKYASGREGDWAYLLVARQKNYISLYFCVGKEKGYLAEWYKPQLPKASIGKSCVRFKKFEDIDWDVLKKMLKETVAISKTGGFVI